MTMFSTRFLLPVVLLAAGFAAGYFSRPEALLEETGHKVPRTPPPAAGRPAVSIEAAGREQEKKEAMEMFSGVVGRVQQLSAEEFGQRYAELLAANDSAEAEVESAAMVALMNGERAAAAYLAYRKRTPISAGEHSQELRRILIVAAQHDGAGTMAAMEKAAPGFGEISSLLHGWAMNDAEGAVSWYNTLEDGDPRRKESLNGLVWGLATKNVDTAGKVFRSLSEEDQLSSAGSLAKSLYSSQGAAAMDAVMQGLSTGVQQQFLDAACDQIWSRPMDEGLTWLAGHVERSPSVSRTLVKHWMKWSSADPAAAKTWAMNSARSNPALKALLHLEGE